jgi:hypothetical protein
MAYTHVIDPVFFVGTTSIALQQTLASHAFPKTIIVLSNFNSKGKNKEKDAEYNKEKCKSLLTFVL